MADDLNRFVRVGETLQAALVDLDGSETFSTLLINLGKCMGGLSINEDRRRLVQALRSGTLQVGYVIMLRDALDEALRDSVKGVE